MAFLRGFFHLVLRTRQTEPGSRSSKARTASPRRAASSKKSTSERHLASPKKKKVSSLFNRSWEASPSLGNPVATSSTAIGDAGPSTERQDCCNLCQEFRKKQAIIDYALDGPVGQPSMRHMLHPTAQNLTPVTLTNSSGHVCTFQVQSLWRGGCVGANYECPASASGSGALGWNASQDSPIIIRGCPDCPARIAEEERISERQMLRELDELEHQTETLERMLARLPPEWMILKIGKMVHAYISQNFRNALKMIKSITVSVIGGITLLLSPPEKSCIICTDAKPVGKFPRGKITANCEHEPQVCLKDLKTWITLELKSKGWESISCPECKEPLRHSDIRKFASRKTFARYETLMTRAALSADPNFRWCLNPSCDSGQIHKIRRNGPKFRCDECKKRFCMFHERPWHEGETCQQFDRRAVVERQKAEEAASAAVIGRTTKKCPGKPGQPCGWNIEKAAGCDHMTCLKCAGEFCYICLAFYGPIRKQGNSMHLPTCRYHSDNIPRQ